ncbi:unnamed protein product, partial [Schistosoma turkestanicum]
MTGSVIDFIMSITTEQDKPRVVKYPEIYLSAALLHPSFLSGTYSVSQKYGILGWLIGRQLISEALSGDYSDKQENSKLTCTQGNASPIEIQTCCLSRQISVRAVEKKNLKQLAADINGLMLSFSAYEKHVMRNGNDSLKEKKSFFEA